MKTSDKTTELTKAYIEVQNDLLQFKQDKQGNKNKYTTYETLVSKIKPLLTKKGIALFQPLDMVEGKKAVTTRIQLGHEFMESTIIISKMDLIVSKAGNNVTNTAQMDGMAITYMKRYALSSFFAIATGDKDIDDDDISAIQAKKDLVDKSFDELLKDTDEELASLIRDGASALGKDLNKKRAFFKQCKDLVLPKAKEDVESAKRMVAGYIL